MADLDIIPGVSFYGGDRTPAGGAIVGAPTGADIFYRERDKIASALASGQNPYGGYQNAVNSIYNTYGSGSGISYQQAAGIIGEAYNTGVKGATQTGGLSGGGAGGTGGGSTGSDDGYTAEDIAYLQGIKRNYLDQRGRLDTKLVQGNQEIGNQYGQEVDRANFDKNEQTTAQTKTKANNYSQINSAANKGYTSLAGILGRASGTGSSAFQEMLPNVIGKDVFSKRTQANNVFGENMSKIDSTFADILADLKRQKDENEENLLTGINETRADIASKLGTVEGQLAAAAGGGTAAIRAAQAPYDAEVRASRDAIDNLFNKYFKPFVPKAAAPDLGTYTMDRSVINAGQQGSADPTNPYAELLRRKLRENENI